MIILHAALVVASALTALAGNYSLCHEYTGDKFFRMFYWWNYPDPTHGTVK